MLKNRFPRSKLSMKSKALSIVLTVFLVLTAIVVFGSGILSSGESKINPPTRNITHNEDLGKITEFNLTIDKLGINVPVTPNVDGNDQKLYDKALNNGVTHYKNTALLGSGSNIVIFGHSSTVWGIGKYAKVFASLDQLNVGDEIKINFNQKEYKYLVNEKKIIAADDLSVILPTEREELTLLTCWPVGTAQKRLAVIARPEKL